jgi:hypothetical protein
MIEVLTVLVSSAAGIGVWLNRRDLKAFRNEMHEMIEGVVRQKGPVTAQVTAVAAQEKHQQRAPKVAPLNL